MGILKKCCLLVELHFDKCHNIMEYLLKYQFDKNPFVQSEISVSIKEITQCPKCLSNDILCWFHTKSLQSSVITDVQNWINDCKMIKENNDLE